MHPAPARTFVIEALSARLLRDHQRMLWRHLFLRDAQRSLALRHEPVFLLGTDAPLHGWCNSELATFCGHFGGCHDACAGDFALMAFTDCKLALRAALLLQQVGGDSTLRAALTASPCTIASFDLDGCRQHLLLPSEEAGVEMILERVPPATLLVGASAYPVMEAQLAAEAKGVLVTTEFGQGLLPEARVTLLPVATSAQSTFAGLGRC